MNDNKKFRPPKVAVTRVMVDAGKAALDMLTADDGPPDVTDDQIVAEIFFRMWEAYWTEIDAVKRRKGGLIVPKHPVITLSRN